jgi:mono/diheme cytochrome c family protein
MMAGFARVTLVSLVVAGACGALATLSAQQMTSQWNGIYTEAQATRGEGMYKENCALCHGGNLEGTEAAPPLTGSALAGKWNNRPVSELFDYLQVFMPWNSPGGLNRQQNADILAYILKRGNFPAGHVDVPTDTAAQSQIRFLANKP